MARPHVSDDLTQVIEEIHRNQKGRKPSSFEDAIETVIQLANESPQQEGWYPGKYAEKAINQVLGQQNSTQMSTNSNTTRSLSSQTIHPRFNPDTQAIFKQKLTEKATVMIPEAERAALGISPGDILQVIAYQSGNPSDNENNQQ